MQFEIWQSTRNNQWYWHLKAANNKIIAAGEGYHNEQDCLHAVNLVKERYNSPVYKLS